MTRASFTRVDAHSVLCGGVYCGKSVRRIGQYGCAIGPRRARHVVDKMHDHGDIARTGALGLLLGLGRGFELAGTFFLQVEEELVGCSHFGSILRKLFRHLDVIAGDGVFVKPLRAERFSDADAFLRAASLL
jgi:hypothetical protein